MSKAITIRTYNDSFLYMNRLKSSGNIDYQRQNNAIAEFIRGSQRIDKKSDAFVGVMEDIKRRQPSSIIYSMLASDMVVLCINDVPLSAAFKVIDALDLADSKKSRHIFIDVSNIITFKNGYFDCNKIDYLIAYLYEAVVLFTYRFNNMKMLNNPVIIKEGADCYKSLFSYIIDYRRIIGYSANKDKIDYMITLFYLNNMMGMELDDRTKAVAAKVAGVEDRFVHAYSMYIPDMDFTNIDTFINTLSEAFKLKGFTTELFVKTWIYCFGTGTQYAAELFSCFINMMMVSYTGSYLVHQKTIERCCAKPEVKLANAVTLVANQFFNANGFLESYVVPSAHKNHITDIYESQKYIDTHKKDLIIAREEFSNLETVKEKANFAVKLFRTAKRNPSPIFYESMSNGIEFMKDLAMNDCDHYSSLYQSDTLSECYKIMKAHMEQSDIDRLHSHLVAAEKELLESSHYMAMLNEDSKNYRKAVGESTLELRNLELITG